MSGCTFCRTWRRMLPLFNLKDIPPHVCIDYGVAGPLEGTQQ